MPPGREVLGEAWEAGYAHLEAFHAAHGHMRVPQRFKSPDGYRLGKWVSRQRQLAHRLGPERRKQLEALGFVRNGLKEAWEAGYAHLEAFRAEHGHPRVPQRFKSPDGYRLGSWVNHQRRRPDQLDRERRERLEALGFLWDMHKEAWEAGYAHLGAFLAEHGHVRVLWSFRSRDGYRLGLWAREQRASADQLDPARRERLEAVDFVWDIHEEAWEEGCTRLEAFHAQHGHMRVPQRFKSPDGYRLGSWVNHQRWLADQLGPERSKRLEALGFVWKVRS